MAGLSVCDDGVHLDPLLIAGCSPPVLAEAEEEDKDDLRGLFFHRIPVPSPAVDLSSRPASPVFHQFLPVPPSPESLSLSHLTDASDQRSFAPEHGGLYDVAVRLSDDGVARCEREGRSGNASHSGSRERTRAELTGVLAWLRGMAIDPRDRTRVVAEEEWLETQVMRARAILFRELDDATKQIEFPLPPPPEKRKKLGKITFEGIQKKNGGKLGSGEVLNQPKRRSERIAQNANQNIRHLLTRRKRIGFGSNFQADVPDWTYPPSEMDISNYKDDPNALKWLGTQIWPEEGNDRKVFEAVIGKGMPNNCACSSPGSIVCIRSHVTAVRLKLKVDLGQAFFDWGFDGMGEEVSKSWTNEEQIMFDALKRLENESGYESFWQIAPTYFSFKSRRDLISYYFNVYLLRRISNQSILTPECMNSDEDDDDDDDENDEDAKKIKRIVTKKRAKVMRNHASNFPAVNRVSEGEESLRIYQLQHFT